MHSKKVEKRASKAIELLVFLKEGVGGAGEAVKTALIYPLFDSKGMRVQVVRWLMWWWWRRM